MIDPQPSVSGFVGLAALVVFASPLPAVDLHVDPAGHKPGSFPSVQQAVDAAPPGTAAERTRILIQPGIYHEQVTVPRDKVFLSLIGLGERPDETQLTYHLKASDPRPDSGTGTVGTSGSSSVFVFADDFVAQNLTFANSAGDNVGQAVAFRPDCERLAVRGCRFLGYQDTLYPRGGRQYYIDCFVTGDTDFIFGDATAVFDRCTIRSTDAGYITAANTRPQTTFGFVFLDCVLTATDNVGPDSVWLGRPWQWDRQRSAQVVFVRTRMGPHVRAAGWHPWNEQANTDPGASSRFGEFGSLDLNGGALDVSRRVPWSHQLSADEAAQLTVERVLAGDDGWDPRAGFVDVAALGR